jgi:GntR family transcriptional regulator, phosphonate transport system regulatory protein
MDKEKKVQRDSGIALWRQIADGIRQSISNGDHDTTMMLPPETALAVSFGVNRHTVRSALAALAEEGIVRPVQGIGTMIHRTRRLKLPLSRRTRFSEGVGSQAKGASATLLSWRFEEAGMEVAEALDVPTGTKCVVLETTHSADGKPISTATNWFDAERFSALPDMLRAAGTISGALAACGVADYERLTTEISAAHISKEDQKRLGLAPGAIVLETTAINAAIDGTPIQYSHSRLSASRSTLTIDFES